MIDIHAVNALVYVVSHIYRLCLLYAKLTYHCAARAGDISYIVDTISVHVRVCNNKRSK